MNIEIIVSTGSTRGICVSQITLEPGESSESHFHEFTTEVYTILFGEGLLSLNGTDHPIGPSSIHVVKPGVIHQIRNTGIIPLEIVSSKDRPRQFKDHHSE